MMSYDFFYLLITSNKNKDFHHLLMKKYLKTKYLFSGTP